MIRSMKATLLCLCFASFGCAGTTPQDILEEFARAAFALNAAYHAECDGREDTQACVDILNAYNAALEHVGLVNAKAAE